MIGSKEKSKYLIKKTLLIKGVFFWGQLKIDLNYILGGYTGMGSTNKLIEPFSHFMG
ncbi:hypothetical protein [Natroniella sp. ANB-PHB2]|uniref:hypothetical protein n=1 Tax=Natroniella sp. ANB-PHB2 TaxID=3384444 RepID=UPI0038D39016